MIDSWGISCKIALMWMPLDLADDRSTMVQVMAWCRQAASHYLSQCWPGFLLPHGVTRPQWVKGLCTKQTQSSPIITPRILNHRCHSLLHPNSCASYGVYFGNQYLALPLLCCMLFCMILNHALTAFVCFIPTMGIDSFKRRGCDGHDGVKYTYIINWN